MAKGRKKGSKVESYTFRFSYVADKDTLARFQTAQLTLKGKGINATRKEMLSKAVEHYLNGLSPQKLVLAVEGGLVASQLREMKAKRAEMDKQIERMETQESLFAALTELED